MQLIKAIFEKNNVKIEYSTFMVRFLIIFVLITPREILSNLVLFYF